MTDIVERLRDAAEEYIDGSRIHAYFTESADEIERLRAEVERLRRLFVNDDGN